MTSGESVRALNAFGVGLWFEPGWFPALTAHPASTPPGELIGASKWFASAGIALKLARLQQKNHLLYDPALKVRKEYAQNLVWTNKVKAAL